MFRTACITLLIMSVLSYSPKFDISIESPSVHDQMNELNYHIQTTLEPSPSPSVYDLMYEPSPSPSVHDQIDELNFIKTAIIELNRSLYALYDTYFSILHIKCLHVIFNYEA